MKLKQVMFGEDENPTSAEFVLTLDEAALLYAFVGRVSPKAVRDAAGDVRWGNALCDTAACLGSFFNRFWDGGASDVAPSINPRVGTSPAQTIKRPETDIRQRWDLYEPDQFEPELIVRAETNRHGQRPLPAEWERARWEFYDDFARFPHNRGIYPENTARLQMGLYAKTADGADDGAHGEWCITWHKFSNVWAPRIEAFGDSWRVLAFSGLLEQLRELPDPTPDRVKRLLVEMGWTDMTNRRD